MPEATPDPVGPEWMGRRQEISLRAPLRDHPAVGQSAAACALPPRADRILWKEILERFGRVEVAGEPVRVRSNFVNGFSELPVRLHPA